MLPLNIGENKIFQQGVVMADLRIHKAIVHRLNKDQHQQIQGSTIRSSVLDSANESVIKLVSRIVSQYATKSNTANFGCFKEGEGRGVFPDAFINYYNLQEWNDQSFIDLSKVAMESLYSFAALQTASSGGYIFFADYSRVEHGRFFIVVMIKQTEGFRMSSNLEPEELLQLDLSKLHQAARISFGKLAGFLAADESDRVDFNYLSFISPVSNKAAAGYFVTGLGCYKGTASSKATDQLIRESVQFFKDEGVDFNKRRTLKQGIIDLLADKIRSGDTVKISEVDAIARQYMKETENETIEDQSDRFIEHLNSEDVAVPNEFKPSKSAVKKHTYITHSATNWEIKIKRDSISEDQSAQICYDREGERLIIKNIPVSLKEDIENQLNSEG